MTPTHRSPQPSTVIRALLLFLALSVTLPALAQSTPPRMAGPRYDPSTVETVQGTVRSVDVQASQYGPGAGVHLTLDLGETVLAVHLGPTWFLDAQDEQVRPGDAVRVVGSRVVLGGRPALIARELRRGDDVLVLRDAAGLPAWRGWRRGARGPR